MANDGNLYTSGDMICNGNVIISDTLDVNVMLSSTFQTNLINMLYPVGVIYKSISNTNPGTYMPGTVWESWGSGRAPVGVDTADGNFNMVEKSGGESSHVLSQGEMPQHQHTDMRWMYPTSAAFGVNYGNANFSWAPACSWYFKYNNVGSGSAQAGFLTDYRGSSQAHNNLQPYITCYMWKRVA